MTSHGTPLDDAVALASDVDQELQSLEHRLEEMPEIIGHEFGSLREEISNVVDDIHQKMSALSEEHGKVEAAHKALEKEIGESSAEITGAIDHTKEAAEHLIHACAAADASLSQMLQKLVERYAATQQTLEEAVKDAAATIRNSEAQWGTGLITFLNEVAASTGNHIADGTSHMSTTHQEVAERHLQAISDEVRGSVSTFGGQLTSESQRLTESVSSLVDSHIAEQVQRITQAITSLQRTVERIQATVTEVTNIIGKGVETTKTVTDEMDSTNVGLKVTIGTVSKIKHVLEELL